MTSSAETISAIIPFYGEPAPVLDLIASLRAQRGITPENLEIIVSDDRSPIPFPDTEGVSIVRRERNGGFGSAVNSGAARARGDWLIILNSDLELGENFISSMLTALAVYPQVLASPQVIGHDGNHQWVARKFPTVGHIAWEWFTPLARFKPTRLWHRGAGHDISACTALRSHGTDWVMGACMMVPRTVYERVQGMDERFYMNSEEVDFQRRLAEIGVPRILVPEVTVTHEGGASSPSARRRQWLTTARFIYAEKWGFEKNLRRALTLTSYANYGFNLVRSLRNHRVNPREILNHELELIRRGTRHEN